ncbi:hypothetical protein IPG41_01185 [Candidatus Peregrinibacteria bacterium]|nr:MAG: hypothetical protein IPG41_01185 [Candidatus Peregrinibacteria bacterium]
MQYLQGFIGMLIGLLILIYRPKIKDFTGDIAFAERYLGSGGTWTFFIILGVGIFILSLLWATGTFQSFTSDRFSQFL